MISSSYHLSLLNPHISSHYTTDLGYMRGLCQLKFLGYMFSNMLSEVGCREV